jgi:hypothetical protein
MQFAMHPVDNFTDFVKIRYGTLPLFCISLCSFLSEPCKLQRTPLLIFCCIMERRVSNFLFLPQERCEDEVKLSIQSIASCGNILTCLPVFHKY